MGPAHGFRKVQIVEELTTCAGAFYNLYLVDVNVFRHNMRRTACSFHHEAIPGLEAKSLLDGVLLCIGHTFIPSPILAYPPSPGSLDEAVHNPKTNPRRNPRSSGN